MRGIDRYIPHSDFRERHLRHVRAPADGVLAAADAYRPEDRFFRRMIGVREWPMRVERALRRRQVRYRRRSAWAVSRCWSGAAGKSSMGWRGGSGAPGYGLIRINDRADFLALCEPGTAKLTLDFTVEPARDGGVTLSTETRIACIGAAARRSVAPYWYLIRPVSGLFSHPILSAVRAASTTG